MMTPRGAGLIRYHAITPEQARDVFADPSSIEWIDEGQDEHEQRFSALGMVENRLLFVAYTTQRNAIRIISLSAAGGTLRATEIS